MQGRLSPMINGKIQSFPKDNWQNEFKLANLLDLQIMEWTIDYDDNYVNPLLLKKEQKEIIHLSKKYSLKTKSLTGDCFMQKPFWKEKSIDKRVELINYMKEIFNASSKVGIELIVIPLVDNGSIENDKQEEILVETLLKEIEFLNKLRLKIIFESDFSPMQYINFIDKFPKKCFGINYDTGNSASLGFNPIEEFKTYGDRIMNVHIKDRVFNGSSVPIFEGDVNFKLVFKLLSKYQYDGNIILQTARSHNKKDFDLINNYKKTMEELILNYI